MGHASYGAISTDVLHLSHEFPSFRRHRVANGQRLLFRTRFHPSDSCGLRSPVLPSSSPDAWARGRPRGRKDGQQLAGHAAASTDGHLSHDDRSVGLHAHHSQTNAITCASAEPGTNHDFFEGSSSDGRPVTPDAAGSRASTVPDVHRHSHCSSRRCAWPDGVSRRCCRAPSVRIIAMPGRMLTILATLARERTSPRRRLIPRSLRRSVCNVLQRK
jgi:hypothetical protein